MHVPKTGGKCLSNFLHPYCDEESLHFSPFKKDGNLHATIPDYAEWYGDSILDYTFVSIVRNPWDKAVSMACHQKNEPGPEEAHLGFSPLLSQTKLFDNKSFELSISH